MSLTTGFLIFVLLVLAGIYEKLNKLLEKLEYLEERDSEICSVLESIRDIMLGKEEIS